MTNLSGNGPTPEFNNRALPASRSGAWMIPLAVVVAIAVVGLGYGYSNGWMTSATAEHGATATATGAPAAESPAKP